MFLNAKTLRIGLGLIPTMPIRFLSSGNVLSHVEPLVFDHHNFKKINVGKVVTGKPVVLHYGEQRRQHQKQGWASVAKGNCHRRQPQLHRCVSQKAAQMPFRDIHQVSWCMICDQFSTYLPSLPFNSGTQILLSVINPRDCWLRVKYPAKG